MDRSLQDLLRQARSEPSSDEGWLRCAAAFRRAGEPLPADVIDAQRLPPGTLPLERTYHSYGYESLNGFHHTPKWKKAPRVPLPHRVWVSPRGGFLGRAISQRLVRPRRLRTSAQLGPIRSPMFPGEVPR